MTLAVYRHVRTRPDAELDALAELGRLCQAEGFELGAALELAAFERQVRETNSSQIATISQGDGSPAPVLASQLAEPAPDRQAEHRPAFTKACVDCGKVRTFSCRSAFEKAGERCQGCNGKYNLARRFEARRAGKGDAAPAGDGEPASPIAPPKERADLERDIPLAGDDDDGPRELQVAQVDGHLGGAELVGDRAARAQPGAPGTRRAPGPRPSLPVAAPRSPRSEAGPPERTARRFKCERLNCGREFIAEAEKGKTVPYCPEHRANPPVIREDMIRGDGTGGLERGRTYRRTVLAPAGWREGATTAAEALG